MHIFLIGILLVTFMMVVAKRLAALIQGFMFQSFILFALALYMAVREKSLELYLVAALILLIKAVLIPFFLRRIARNIKVGENAGLFVNPTISLAAAVALTYLAHLFAREVIDAPAASVAISFAISLSVILSGLFIMVFRMKALVQVIGLLVMENGLFLAAISLCGNMPFFVEIAIFFDIFVCVIILGVFVYRINDLFTHIDADKLTTLKG